MMYYIFIQNNKINGTGQCTILNEDIQSIEITEEIYNKYCEDPDLYIWNGEAVVENPDYLEIKRAKREEEFNRNFFPTHLGYVKREVTMKNGSIKDFLTDLRSSIRVGLPVFVYDKPDFTQEVTSETLLACQRVSKMDQQFLNDCDNQFAIDFYGFNPLEQLQEEQDTEEVLDNTEE